MNAGNRHDIANAKTVEVIQLHRRFADFITLVDCQNHRLAAAHQHTGNILVLSGNASANFAHHDNTICGINGDLGLFPHMGQQAVVNVGLNAAGINQQEKSSGETGKRTNSGANFKINLLNINIGITVCI
jgi:hypothetical protein